MQRNLDDVQLNFESDIPEQSIARQERKVNLQRAPSVSDVINNAGAGTEINPMRRIQFLSVIIEHGDQSSREIYRQFLSAVLY